MPTLLSTYLERVNRRTAWLISIAIIVSIFFTFSYFYDLHSPDLNKFGDNVWFQGDITRIYDNMTNRYAHGHYRANVHPIYSLLTYPPSFLLKNLFSSDALAVKSVTLVIASCWLVSFFTFLRIMGCQVLDALIFTALGFCTSAAMFWLYVPETYALASVSMMFAVGLSMLSQKENRPDWIFATVSAFSIGVTITNWMAGLVSTFTSLPHKRALKVACLAIMAVIILWALQKLIFPSSQFFVGNSEETKYMFAPSLARLISVSNVFLLHSVVTPEIKVTALNQFAWPLLSIQSSTIGSSGMLGWFTTILWVAILSLGIWAFITLRQHGVFKVTLALTLIGQFALHFIYGEETFLYTLNFAPLLVFFAALTTLTRFRKTSVTLCLILIPLLFVNNLTQLKLACTLASSSYSSTEQ